MKPLSIEELKELKENDYFWLVNINDANKNIYISNISYTKETLSGLDFYNYSRRMKWDNYGKTWLAFKNKEQAECKGVMYEFPCELGTTIYYIKKQCRDFFNDFEDNEDNWCEDYEQGSWYDVERCNLASKDYCSLNLEIYCEECKHRLKIEETKFCIELRDKIYGTDYYNKNFSLSNTYFLTKEQAEQKLKELRGEV